MRITKDLLEAKRAKLLEQIREVDQAIEDLTPPEPASGCIRFEKSYRGSSGVYSYAAIRAQGRWWVTGQQSPQCISWKALLDFIRKDNVLIHAFSEVTSVGAPTVI